VIDLFGGKNLQGQEGEEGAVGKAFFNQAKNHQLFKKRRNPLLIHARGKNSRKSPRFGVSNYSLE